MANSTQGFDICELCGVNFELPKERRSIIVKGLPWFVLLDPLAN